MCAGKFEEVTERISNMNQHPKKLFRNLILCFLFYNQGAAQIESNLWQ